VPAPEAADREVTVRSEDVRTVSARRDEPDWLLRFRIASLESLEARWSEAWSRLARDLDGSWIFPPRRPPPAEVRSRTTESEAAHRAVRKELATQDVLLMGLDAAIHQVPDLVERAFGSLVTADDGPHASLNGAIWSGGTFLHVPKGVHVRVPLQAEIREDFVGTQPFERNLLLLEEGASAEFIDGCTAPVLTSPGVHASAVEVIALAGARIRYTALQNWARSIDDHVAGRAQAHANSSVEWRHANLGARRNGTSPSVHLVGRGARAEIHTLSVAGTDQDHEICAEAVHAASDTSSRISVRGIARSGGRIVYAPKVTVAEGASRATTTSEWSALLLDESAHWMATPSIEIHEADAAATQRGSAEPIRESDVFYLTSRGMSRTDAVRILVGGFLAPFARRLPLEYGVEVQRLVDLDLEGAIG
jgi:Fe-S cluster assembly protein SufB